MEPAVFTSIRGASGSRVAFPSLVVPLTCSVLRAMDDPTLPSKVAAPEALSVSDRSEPAEFTVEPKVRLAPVQVKSLSSSTASPRSTV
jgi:hypothetical protein